MTLSRNQLAPHSIERAQGLLSFVTVQTPHGHPSDCGFVFEGPVEVVLDQGDFVFVMASCFDELPPECLQVSDGRCKGVDYNGNRIVSVPAEWCWFYSAEEAQGIDECIEADARLLSYAR